MPSSHVLRWVFAAIAVVLAFLLGSVVGAYRERSAVITELNDAKTELASIDDKYQSELASLRTQRDIADASNRSLQDSLKQFQAQALDEQSAQHLYQRIEGDGFSSGLAIDTIAKVTDDQGVVTELHVTVVQARGRDRVKGRVGVALLGEKNNSNWREVIVDANSDSAPRFDMRFFQTLVVPIEADDILIDIVEIDVVPSGKRHKAFTFEQAWSGILQE